MATEWEPPSICGVGYIGLGDAIGRLAAGIRTNRTTMPFDACSYTAVSLDRDTVGAIRRQGGRADVLLVSPEFPAVLALWGDPPRLAAAPIAVFGVPVVPMETVMLGDVAVVVAPALERGSALAFGREALRAFTAGHPTMAPRRWLDDDGIRVEIEVVREPHCAFVGGIGGFSR